MYKSWIEAYTANIQGVSQEAKGLEAVLKKNFKGNVYMPWATMERLMLQQDPNAVVDGIENPIYGLPVWMAAYPVATYQNAKGEIVETKTEVRSYFVKLKGVFFGKEMFEVYPIQNNDYTPALQLDANSINKALQRGKARLIARLTGLAISLYESGDLQFEEETNKTKPNEKKTKLAKAPAVAVETPTEVAPATTTHDGINEQATPSAVASVDAELPSPTNDTNERTIVLATTIKARADELMTKIRRINTSLSRQYDFVLDPYEDSVEVLAEKLSKIVKLDLFERNLLG